MAVNLNPPSHFTQPVLDREQKAQGSRLLPPSSFQKRNVPDPWQALAQAKGRIDELQQENDQLRKSKPREEATKRDHPSHLHPCSAVCRDGAAPAPAPPPPPPQPPSFPAHEFLHLQHTADILSKQAAELAQVKSEVMTLRSQRQREVGELEERLREAEVKHATEMTSLAASKKCREEEHRMEMSLMKTKHEAETADKQEKIDTLREELLRTQAQCEQEVGQLRERLLRAEAEREKALNEFGNSNREKDLKIKSLEGQVNQLKAYIGDTQAASRSTAQWQVEREKQLKKIQELERDLDKQQSAAKLLNVRLSSTNEILGIQEVELSRVKGESATNSKKTQLLLKRWREKVFELLVQLKSQEIVEENLRRDHKWQMTELEEERTTLQSKCHLLEHSIADRDAQLQLERGQNQSLRDELVSVQQVAELLDSRLGGYEEAVPQLTSLLRSFQMEHKGMEKNLGGLTSKLGSFDQRINFAVGRIEILKGLVARKDALWRLREQEIRSSSREPAEAEDENAQDDNDRLSHEQLRQELQQVTHERDALAARIKLDSDTLQQQYNAVREQFESKQEEDASRLRELESQLRQKSEDLRSVSTKLDNAESECQESQQTVGKLRTELTKLQLSAERASADKMVAMETQLTNQLAEMEQRLNAARREQAKAVVSLRQLERQTVRERERSVEMLKTQEEHFHLELERLASQLREADKDRNLLMATLKQEGLVGHYKAQRATARRLDSDAEDTMQKPTSEAETRPEKVKGHTGHHIKEKAPLHTILTDLQSLTAQVLQDEDDTDDDDDGIQNTDKG